MKKIKIITNYYRGHRVSVVFISLVFTFLLFYIVFVAANITPYHHALKLYEQANLRESFYYVASGGLAEPYDKPNIPVLQALPAVKDIVYLKYGRFVNKARDIVYNIYAFPDSTAEAFPIHTMEGQWLTEFPADTAEDGTVQAVVCGDAFSDTEQDDTIPMQGFNSDTQLSIKAAGKLRESTAIPYFGRTGGALSTDMLFQIATYSNYMILVREKDIDKLGYDFTFSGLGCFVRLDENASQESREAALDYLNHTGRVTPYPEILLQGQQAWETHIKDSVLFPSALVLIFFIAYISLFVLLMEQKGPVVEIYFLCGYTTRNAILDFTICMLVPIVIPMILTGMFILNLLPLPKELAFYLMFADASKTVEKSNVLALGVCFLVCLALSWALSWQKFRKKHRKSEG